MRLPPACTDRGSVCGGMTHRFALRVWLPLEILVGLWTADLPRFPARKKNGTQKRTRYLPTGTNRKAPAFGFPTPGGAGWRRMLLRPYPAGRKR